MSIEPRDTAMFLAYYLFIYILAHRHHEQFCCLGPEAPTTWITFETEESDDDEPRPDEVTVWGTPFVCDF